MEMKPIGVGDLVMLKRWPHKCEPENPRIVFVVQEMTDAALCQICHERYDEPVACAWRNGNMTLGYPVSWLTRIEPLTEQEKAEELQHVSA
jgi:hypothetical protein